MSKVKVFKAKVAPSKVLKTADVVAVTSDEGEELKDTEFVAKVIHGRGAVFRRVASLRELVAYLKEFESIRRLVFMFHGSSGEMLVGENKVKLSEIARSLREARATLRCSELVFEGCNVGSGGREIASLMEALQARLGSGYATFHAWGVRRFLVRKGDSSQELEKQPLFKRIKRFIIAGQPSPAEMVQSPGFHSLAIEYFSSTPARDHIIDTGLAGEVERLNDRSKLEQKTLSIANAQKAEQYDTVVGSMTIVTILR
jgi:hypothetical protein